jgi:hypothetical protein
MNKKEILSKIKLFFSDVTEEMKFIDLKTKDGLILRVDNLEPEMLIQEVTEDGLVDLEDGTYELEDGLQLVVAEGMIKEIIEPQPETPEEDATDLPTEMEVTDYSADIASLRSDMDLMKAEMESMRAEMDKMMGMNSKYETLSTELETLRGLKTELETSNTKFESLNTEFSEFKSSASGKPIDVKHNFSEVGLDAKLKQWKR